MIAPALEMKSSFKVAERHQGTNASTSVISVRKTMSSLNFLKSPPHPQECLIGQKQVTQPFLAATEAGKSVFHRSGLYHRGRQANDAADLEWDVGGGDRSEKQTATRDSWW